MGISELNSKLDSKEKEISILKEKIKNNDTNIELKEEIEGLRKDLMRSTGKINDLEIKLYKVDDDKNLLDKFNKALEEKLKKNSGEMENVIKEFQQKINAKEDENINFRNKVTHLEMDIQEKELKINSLQEKINLIEQQKDRDKISN